MSTKFSILDSHGKSLARVARLSLPEYAFPQLNPAHSQHSQLVIVQLFMFPPHVTRGPTCVSIDGILDKRLLNFTLLRVYVITLLRLRVVTDSR